MRGDKGWLSVLYNFLPNFIVVAKAAYRTRIAHGGAAGWAFPLAYYLYPLKPLFDFKSVFVVESSFWMKPSTRPVSLRQHISHVVNMFMVKRMVRQADAPIFTQTIYRDLFLGSRQSTSLINEAVWVNAEEMVAEPMRSSKALNRKGPVRLVFPSRLVMEKGVTTVLNAIAKAEQKFQENGRSDALQIDIVGTGALEQSVLDFISAHTHYGISVRLLPPVAYGRSFFDLVGNYDAGIVANLHEEQPRIIYDLFSQGIPCIASRTSGVEHIARDGESAILFPPGDAEALAELLVSAADMRGRLSAFGAAALELCMGKSHRSMHERRAVFLKMALGL